MIFILLYLLGLITTYWIVDTFHSDWLEDPFTSFTVTFWPITMMWYIVSFMIKIIHKFNPIKFIYNKWKATH